MITSFTIKAKNSTVLALFQYFGLRIVFNASIHSGLFFLLKIWDPIYNRKYYTIFCTPGGIRTHTVKILSLLSLPLEYRSFCGLNGT